MRSRPVLVTVQEPDILTIAAATWLACGVVLLGLTPLPLRDATLGWSPAFRLLAAPCLLLLAKCMLASRRAPMPLRDALRPAHRSRAPAVRRSAASAKSRRRSRKHGWHAAA